ncbi:unnamed protein product, partial [Allacma fusca]
LLLSGNHEVWIDDTDTGSGIVGTGPVGTGDFRSTRNLYNQPVEELTEESELRSR